MEMENKYPNRLTFVLEDSLAKYRNLIINCGIESVTVPRNTVLSRGGESTRHVYFILDGMTKASVVNANGYERILGYQKKNTFCAMDGLRNDEGVFVTVTTVVDSNVIPLDIDRIAGLMSGNRDFSKGYAALLFRCAENHVLGRGVAEQQLSPE